MITKADKCKTRYPLFMVHGTGFRDFKHISYWGRIPKKLEEHGAKIFYGYQDSWASVEENARTLKNELSAMIQNEHIEKVNIIAHSKGGLEARYLVSCLGCAPWVASITTISTPHNGSKTMDMLLKLPKPLIHFAGFFVNCWFRLLGDKTPDFYTTCHQFTSEYTKDFNQDVVDMSGIFYQSVATVMNSPASDMLMWFPSLIVSLVEGENDGLVTPESAMYWDNQYLWKSSCRRGISHADSVDMRRKAFSKDKNADDVSDIVDAYVNLISELANCGY